MPARVTSCPNCGGQVEFRAGTSLLAVCPYCASAVARIGGDVDEATVLGKVAPLADLGSPLSIGTSGSFRGKNFTLVGCLQLDYGRGPWNEWYAAFDDGAWGWVAEAQGKVYLTFGKPIDGLPSFPEATVGTPFRVGTLDLRVVERRQAEFTAAAGELPVAVKPGSTFRYADVQGKGRVFGTIDYGSGIEPETLFIGEELSYEDLFGRALLRDGAKASEAKAAVAMNCPHCGAGIRLKAPDTAERVTCDACGSLLDCKKGSELFLLSSAKPTGPAPLIPLSSEGTLFGGRYTVFGHLVRSVSVEGVRYFWEEYLLHQEHVGFRWLVVSDNHYSFVEPIHAGDVVSGSREARAVEFEGLRFRLFQAASSRVESLRGEFYWKVEVGERAATRDYVSPPYMLSVESTAEEVVWSKGTYIAKEEVERAFKLKKRLPRPVGIAPNQPNPRTASARFAMRAAAIFSFCALLLGGLFLLRAKEHTVMDAAVGLQDVTVVQRGPDKLTGAPLSSETFELASGGNVAIRVESDVSNSWLYLAGTLENVTMARGYPFGAEVSYYSGYENGESWSEGGREKTVFLGEIPSGQYVLKFAPEWSPRPAPRGFRVSVTSDVFMGSHLLVLFALLWIFPVIETARQFSFEKRRWAESDAGDE